MKYSRATFLPLSVTSCGKNVGDVKMNCSESIFSSSARNASKA